MSGIFLGIDLGTTGIKVILMQADGKVVDKNYADYPILTPRPDYAEQNPQDWWNSLCRISKELLQRNSSLRHSIIGVGITGQMHTQVYLDREGNSLGTAITWMDQRTQAMVDQINQVHKETIFQHTSNYLTTTYTAPHILWVKRNRPELYAKTAKILLAKDYLKYRLTGEMVTDYSDAAGTLLFDVGAKRWSQEMFGLFEIDESLMPAVGKSALVIGRITAEAAQATGISEGVPVINGCADHAATSLGAGVINPGDVSAIVGTAGVVSVLSDQPVPDERYGSLCWNYCLEDRWINLAVMQTAGESLNWFKRAFDGEDEDGVFDTYNLEAAKVPEGSGGLVFLPYLMGERNPYWDPQARGVFFGIGLGHNKYHFVRAVMEGVGFAFKNNLELIESLGVEVGELRLLGGGAKSPLWRELLARILNRRMKTVQVEETGALGSCLLCGSALGLFTDLEAASRSLVNLGDEYYCSEMPGVYKTNYEIFKELYPSLRGLYQRMTD